MTLPAASGSPARTRYPKLEFLIVALAAVFVFLMEFKLPYFPVFTEEDELIFIYEAWRMLNGDVIYRDFFEFVTPGSQVYYYAALTVFGAKYWLLPATVVLLVAACSFVLLQVSRWVIDGPLYLLPALTFVFFGFRWFGPDGSHRMFSPIFVMAAVFAMLGGTDRSRLILAGGLCALTSFFTQQRGFVALAAFVVFVGVDTIYSSRPFGEGFRKAAVLIAAYSIILLAFCLPFIVSAGADNFFGSTVVYPALYYGYVRRTITASIWSICSGRFPTRR